MHANEVFKALADPTRREILELLRGGERTAGELAAGVSKSVSKPSMSHHFDVLRQADLIRSRRQGQQVIYSLNTTVVEDLVAIVWNLFSASGATTSSSSDASTSAALHETELDKPALDETAPGDTDPTSEQSS